MTTVEEFREFGRAMIDYVADYLENIRDRRVLPEVRPGYLKHLVPTEAPEEPEQWKDVMKGRTIFLPFEHSFELGVVHKCRHTTVVTLLITKTDAT